MKNYLFSSANVNKVTNLCILLFALAFMFGFTLQVEATTISSRHSQFIDIDGRQLHVIMYGDMIQQDNKIVFNQNTSKKTIVFTPGLGDISPEITFKPLAESLVGNFNVLIVEPFGTGQSGEALTERTIFNINKEFDEVLEYLMIDKFILAPSSVSGIYALDYILNYDKVEKIMALDITVHDDYMDMMLEEELVFLLMFAEIFNSSKASFSSDEEFMEYLVNNSEQYFLFFPNVDGYEYSEEDVARFFNAATRRFNPTIINEIHNAMENARSVSNNKFPSSIPVISLVSGMNIEFIPHWETAHVNQLDFSSDNHMLYILDGAYHNLWETHLPEIVNLIQNWDVDSSPMAPGRPIRNIQIPADSEVLIKWSAPLDTGASAIIGYQVSKDNGDTWVIVRDTSYTFANLVNGVTYDFMIRAVNAAGSGAVLTVTGTPTAINAQDRIFEIRTAIQGYFDSLADSLYWSLPKTDEVHDLEIVEIRNKEAFAGSDLPEYCYYYDISNDRNGEFHYTWYDGDYTTPPGFYITYILKYDQDYNIAAIWYNPIFN